MEMALYVGILGLVFGVCLCGAAVYLFFLIVRALKKYLRASDVRRASSEVRKSLGEAIREHRVRCKMTQEFVAERLGVSRQAVSKWESGRTDPSTSNLLALAKLFEITAEELLRGTDVPNGTE